MMRQNGQNQDLDLILEEDKRRNPKSGYRVIDGSRQGNAVYRQQAGQRYGASTPASRVREFGGRQAQIQLWEKKPQGQRERVGLSAREAQIRYRKAVRRKRRRRQLLIARTVAAVSVVLLFCLGIFGLWKLGTFFWKKEGEKDALSAMQMWEEERMILDNRSGKPLIEEDLLTPNEYSRPGEPLPEVTEIFVHYTANAGTSAAQNRSYFENLGITGETSASAHFVIGYEGEIIQCLPLDEIGYAVKEHNYNSISIECCYLQEDGKFEEATYQSLLELLGWLMNEYDLGPSAIKRHYDSCGKICPKYYVEHEDAWEQLLKDVETYIS